ncbi:MAG: aminoacetone oxidase family FAD-binding enzyme [Oscillospiraceae bacterium]|jgi:predicted Rossmann fold flavoprotein|nr:aminoacetone oxidase family FAD-binding enzyme [Oscillospiraceae bacterium]
MSNIIIIGGGASGFMAAITAAQELKAAGKAAEITILERLERVGKKLIATGNGTCNITNIACTPKHYHGGERAKIQAVLEAFPPTATMEFFNSIGVLCKVEAEGERVYPYSLQASSVLDCLRAQASRLGIKERCGAEVTAIKAEKGKLALRLNNEQFLADAVIFAAGGKAAQNLGGVESGYRLLQGLGHSLKELFPSLVQVRCPSPVCKSLKGIKQEGRASVLVDGKVLRTQSGEILFTEYGLSGPPILQLSRLVSEFHQTGGINGQKRRSLQISLNLMPEYTPLEIAGLIKARAELLGAEPVLDLLTGTLNKRLGQALLKAVGVSPLSRSASSISSYEIKLLAQTITDWRLETSGVTGWNNAQVTAGGIPLEEIDVRTMESLKVKGLYITGEVLDADGDCGGFNLQWAWSTGHIAGKAAAKLLLQFCSEE